MHEGQSAIRQTPELKCIAQQAYDSALSVQKALLHKDLKCKAPLIEPNLRRNLGKWST